MKTKITLVLSLLLSPYAIAKPHKAHVHGAVQVILAIESDKKLTIDIDAPGDSIVGYEHQAKTESDKKKIQEAIDFFNNKPSEILNLAEELGCTSKTVKAGLESENGQHSEMEAEIAVTCEKSFKGAQVTLGLMKQFKRIKKISVEIIGTEKPTKITLKKSDQTVGL
jgi:hypothetical protein